MSIQPEVGEKREYGDISSLLWKDILSQLPSIPNIEEKGIGRELLKQAMKNAHLKKVWAEVRRSNQGAQTFYTKLGFQIAGVVPNYYGNEDALIVQWTPAMHKSG
jgi:GNAT superfamily N-acetyltransferase